MKRVTTWRKKIGTKIEIQWPEKDYEKIYRPRHKKRKWEEKVKYWDICFCFLNRRKKQGDFYENESWRK